ncbi:LCP family protein [Geitlerinema sp. PCC 7407]|uniref:LCP family protein n=1 Tax=Geitlerinema sp. PCC 7407 TaxID=1173025 RepID=UPI00029F86AD|nr:LCP family protein [Geitlerinema sp. PCC 7407]AFY66095.1 transcriptional attenuator, LytR family [Geitlerinema sp. PCC 7407]
MSSRKPPTYQSPPKQIRKKAPPPRKAPKRSSSIRWMWMLFGLTGVAMLSATAGALLAVSLSATPLMQRQLTAEEAEVFTEEESISTKMNLRLPELTRPVNILILGTKVLTSDLDTAPQQDLGYHALVNSFDGLSDTMMLVRFDPSRQALALLSIPRDTRAYIENVGTSKINAANSYGGPALAARATSELLGGVGVDRYVRINVQGVEKLIDALGGVTLYVPQDMKYQDDSQHLYINLKAGKQHLNGKEALQFLRFRYDNYGDIGRVQRQQTFIRALKEQALNPTTIARLPKILSVIQENLDTNLTVEELVALVGFASRTERSNVEMLMVPGRFSAADEYEASYWIPDPSRIDTMMAQHFGLGYSEVAATPPAYLRVAIQDSTGDYDAPQSVIDVLGNAGFGDVYVDTPRQEPLQVTRIVAQQGDVESAEAVRQVLGLGEVRVESTGELRSDVTVQLGQDWIRRYGN